MLRSTCPDAHSSCSQIDLGWPSGNASIHTWAAWAETLVHVADDAGVSASLPRALRESLKWTIELGQGDKDFPAVYEAFRPLPSTSWVG